MICRVDYYRGDGQFFPILFDTNIVSSILIIVNKMAGIRLLC